MRRDLDRLSRETFDLLVIGGGITGTCIARDAARRGLKVALVEKNDFANATSAHNSKLIHGGLRYLRNLELALVRESLKERRIWQRTAPHLVRPLAFLVPLYRADGRARATLAAGLSLYDVLSYDRRWLDDPSQRLPRHRWLGPAEACTQEPSLAAAGLNGAFLYYDAQMYSPERLALECVIDATAQGAVAANHVEAQSLLLRDQKVHGASVRDGLGNVSFDIRAKLTVIATGPWADIFLARSLAAGSVHKLIRSKGIHVVVPSLTRTNALTVATRHGHFFVLPWRGMSLLGTTDTAFDGSPDSVGVTESDIEQFLAFVNANLPGTHLRRDDVRHFYAGLRPLVDDGSRDTYAASRRAELLDHASSDRIDGLVSVIGGKWTTSRHLAEKAVDLAVAKLGTAAGRCSTATAVLPGGNIGRLASFMAEAQAGADLGEASAHLRSLYGGRLGAVLSMVESHADLARTLGLTGDIGAQVVYAVRNEMALTLEDVVMRRTGIGQLGHPGAGVLEATAELMAGELGWSESRKRAEIAAIEPIFRTARPEQ